MLDVKNIVIDNTTISGSTGGNQEAPAPNSGTTRYSRLAKLKGLLDIKCAAFLRLCATKNVVNRMTDYHYLCLAVSQSTAPVNDIDYIHPVVKPAIDYTTAVITKGLCPNGEIDFEFVPDTEADTEAAQQATLMTSRVLNSMNDPHKFLREWVQDATMHKNGMMMIIPVREKIVLYREIEGTLDQLKAFEVQAEEAGLKAQRQSRRKLSINMQQVVAETQQYKIQAEEENTAAGLEEKLNSINAQLEGSAEEYEEEIPDPAMEMQVAASEEEQALQDSVARNTIYRAKYKLTGYNLNIRLRHVAQHYWICDPNVTEIQEQPFCGFYDPMTIQEATELYPNINLDEFCAHAEYNQNGAFQAGSVLNNLAMHARDSVPTMGIPVNSGASSDPYARQVTILTCWDRYDIDGDGELELVEIVCSGSYIISAKEVEFIPIANMNPKPLPGNFFGMSIGESVVPMQEYMTSMHRAEIQLGLLQSTSRIGVKPDRVDFEQLMDGEAAIFILDSKFDPSTDVYPLPVPNGNIQFIEPAMERMQQDTMAMVGMTQPTDVFNPEVMAPGNSGIKLQMALTPNQLIQDDTIKNCAEGLKEAVWLVWRTLVQYGDDYGVKKLAQLFNDEKQPLFYDFQSFDDLNFCERKQIHISLGLGMRSEENALARIQIIKQCQMELYQMVQAMVQAGTLTPEVYQKLKKPFSETLFTLGIKDEDSYLPSDEEVGQMIKQGQEAAKNKQPSPDEQAKIAKAQLDTAKAFQTQAETMGTDAETKLDLMAIASGTPKVYS